MPGGSPQGYGALPREAADSHCWVGDQDMMAALETVSGVCGVARVKGGISSCCWGAQGAGTPHTPQLMVPGLRVGIPWVSCPPGGHGAFCPCTPVGAACVQPHTADPFPPQFVTAPTCHAVIMCFRKARWLKQSFLPSYRHPEGTGVALLPSWKFYLHLCSFTASEQASALEGSSPVSAWSHSHVKSPRESQQPLARRHSLLSRGFSTVLRSVLLANLMPMSNLWHSTRSYQS